MSASNFSLKSDVKVVWIKRGLALSVLAGFGWLVISSVTSGINDENLEPMTVKAPELVKQRPEAPGGMKIDHQDKQLFDLLETESSVDSVNNSVVAKAKKIELKNEQLAAQAIEKKKLEEKLVVEKAKQAKVAEQLRLAELKKQLLVEKQEATNAALAAKATAVKPSAPVVAKQPVKTAPVPVEKTTASVTAPVAGWAVQLGSFRKNFDAKRAVNVYNKKVGNILTGLNPYIKKVDLGAKGTVYRVYFTGLNDKAHAKQICQQLKVQKQACLRAKI